jgi:hypothetical protein
VLSTSIIAILRNYSSLCERSASRLDWDRIQTEVSDNDIPVAFFDLVDRLTLSN